MRRTLLSFAAFLLIFVAAPHSLRAQSGVRPKPTPSPTPSNQEGQDDEKVFVEEVRIPVFAYDEKGRFDPTLELEDVLVVEDGVPQQVRSVRRVPASVLLLLHAGGELNPAMRTKTTSDIASSVLSALGEGDSFAAMQFSGRTEVLQDWTTEKTAAARAIRSKMFPGKGSNLSLALARAAEYFQTQPVGNRHLVLITDGVDTAGPNEYQAAVKKLLAAQTTLHVISYTAVGRKELKKQSKYPKEVAGAAQSRADMATVGIDPTRPAGMRRDGINPPQVNGGIRFDPALRRQRKAYEDAMKKGESKLKSLTEETGGRILMAGATEEMITQGGDVAREINAQYVVTYSPKRALANSPPTEYRYIRVGARRVGLQLRARRGYVVGAMR
ncbi:MAG TPA: VWA domain-containing protein [Pyrinomonadaceae bacterium]|nr:VWA domain-containing protein [Pyrinomonadaceae bacterium]